ncbi:MAG: AAA family ATPase [Actinomycetia bacterium]|nr:AAA family ATPase [Actinomycetes bacterium]
MDCPSCSRSVPHDARFCSHCGQQLAGLGPDERRVATVLFADLVGFTGLAEGRDPEQVKQQVNRALERLVRVVTTFGGSVDKVLGDGILAVFGAPVAHEDDAERAVRAALRMHETLATHSPDIRMRVGVNTGEVLVGAMAGGDYTAMGDSVNTAQRLQTVAEPGQVLVGPTTRTATEGVIAYHDLGPLELRGRQGAIVASVATGTLLPPGYRPRRVRAPLVGRDDELATLDHLVELTIRRERAHLVVIQGEAGVGKSRLAEEAALRAISNHQANVLEGRCVPYGEANIWWPLAETVRRAVGLLIDDPAEVAREEITATLSELLAQPLDAPEVIRVTTGLLRLLGYEGELGVIEPERAHTEAVRSVLRLYEALLEQGPLVVVLSDLHWADDLVLKALEVLLERLGRRCFGFVVSVREPISDRWQVDAGVANTLLLRLDPLGEQASADLLVSLLGDDVASGVRQEILDRGGGNPFFLEELVSLVTDSPSPLTPAAELGALPDTLRGLVAARLDTLTDVERETLQDAAVLGRDGPIDGLHVMASAIHGRKEASAALSGLVSGEVLDIDGARYEFRNDLVRDVTYGTITKADRAARHAGIADYLDPTTGSETSPRPLDEAGARDVRHHLSDGAVERLAQHYGSAASLAVDLDAIDGWPSSELRRRALVWIDEAVTRSEQKGVHVLTERHTERALELVGDESSPLSWRLELARASALGHLRRLDAAHQLVEKVAAEALEHEHGPSRARAKLVEGDLAAKAGHHEEAARLLDEAVTLHHEIGDPEGVANARRLRALAEFQSGRPDEAVVSLAESRAEFIELGDRRGEAWVLQGLAWLEFSEGQVLIAQETIDESLTLFEELGDNGGLTWARGLLAWIKFHLGERAEAAELGALVLTDAADRGDRWGEGMMLALQASIALWSGRGHEAVAEAGRALALFRAIADDHSIVLTQSLLGRALVAVGRVAEGLDQLDQAVEVAEQAGDQAAGSMAATAQAAASSRLGEPDRALRWAAAAEVGELDPTVIGEGDQMVALAIALLQLGQADQAVTLLDQNLQRAGDLPSPYAQAALAVGLLAMGRIDEGVALADEVVTSGRSTYQDRALARTALAAAAVRTGDVEGVRAVLEELSREVSTTDDRLAQANIRRLEAVMAEALGGPEAQSLHADADRRYVELGTSGHGWVVLNRSLLGPTP